MRFSTANFQNLELLHQGFLRVKKALMALGKALGVTAFRRLSCTRKSSPTTSRFLSSTSMSTDAELEAMLSTPSWSVKSLFQSTSTSKEPPITQKQLHHLLRLSALPLPTSAAEEERMIKDLHSQLKFVQAIQSVDTTDVEPLQSIRDEREDAEAKREITVTTLQKELEKEEVVGRRGRIRRKKDLPIPEEEKVDGWDPLAQAPRTLGKFIVVDTAKD